MKRIIATIFVFLTTIAPAIAAETTDRNESVLDAHPECMQVNGPDCVLGVQAMPSRTAAPPGTPVLSTTGVVVVPAPTPPGTIAPPSMVVPQGVVGVPATVQTITTEPGTSTVITPASPGVNFISPRR